MSFATLGLRAELLRAVSDTGYTVPTPVQTQAIPVILEGRDILAGAQTGTGKTAGFTLPLLQRLFSTSPQQGGGRRPIRALILTPTRELAAQVEESVRTYGKYLPLTSTAIFGGVNIVPQFQRLHRGVDILVATPGRLLDHVNQRTVDLSHVEILVLDEADRMLDMGFIRDIRRVLTLLPPKHQNLLFSATFSEEIKTLADGLLNSPVRVEVGKQNSSIELVTQAVYMTTKDNKRDMLVHLLMEEKIEQALIFTRTKHGADRLVKQLQQDGISSVPIHGNRSQFQRTRALADFKNGAARILVATDIAARGIDIDQLPHVINYELPNNPEDYIHRIGRTGRAGSTGEAISLVGGEEQLFLFAIERLLKRRIERRVAKGFSPRSASERSALEKEPQVVPPMRPQSNVQVAPRPERPAERPAPPVTETPRSNRRVAHPTVSPRQGQGAPPPRNTQKRAPRWVAEAVAHPKSRNNKRKPSR